MLFVILLYLSHPRPQAITGTPQARRNYVGEVKDVLDVYLIAVPVIYYLLLSAMELSFPMFIGGELLLSFLSGKYVIWLNNR